MTDNRRDGKGFRWNMEEKTAIGSRTMSGYTIDNLDSKKLSEASDSYERTFILIRQTLESHEEYCTSVESERLQCTQAIADALHGRS